MFRFPFFGYPYNHSYYNHYNKYNSNHVPYIQPISKEEKNSITNSDRVSNTINPKSSSHSEQPIFEIFGIKLYMDDLIIIGLLFFLYQQNVQDEMLYIILILLLFS